MEKIKCAAIKYRLKDAKEFSYLCAMSHGDCIGLFSAMGLPVKKRDISKEVQGFMTTRDRFVDRKEAMFVARAANQLKLPCYANEDRLDSSWVNYCSEE